MSQSPESARSSAVPVSAADTSARPSPAGDYPERGVPFWLPPSGSGNGLSAPAWAEILQIPGRSVAPVLSVLPAHDIAGFVDLAADETEHRVLTGQAGYRLWVDSHQYSRAEDLLMRVLRGDRRVGVR